MTDDKTRQLENRIDKLESTIEKMMPSRRDALKMGGAALVGGAAMSGTASAGTNQVGTIGASPNDLVDIESEDINNADTVTTQDLVVNGTATGPFGGGGIVFEEGDSIQDFTGDRVSVGAGNFFDIFNLSSAVDIYGGIVYGREPTQLRITFDSNNTTTIGTNTIVLGTDFSDDLISGNIVIPMKAVKRLECINSAGATEDYGFRVFTT